MTVKREAARRDQNELEIVEHLRNSGYSVFPLSDVGVPDLLVGTPTGTNLLLEVKSTAGKLTEAQEKFHASWKGQKAVVRNIRDVEKIINPPQPQVRVLDVGFVRLERWMCDEQELVKIARESHMSTGSPESDVRLLRYLFNKNETSPFEHTVLGFYIQAPMIVWWQWVRHRHASYTLRSGRYTRMDGEFYRPERHEKWDDAMYQSYIDIALEMYETAISSGVPKELARLYIPVGVYYTGHVTMNLRSVLNFLALREDKSAQYEIRQYALAIHELVRPIIPIIIDAYESSDS